jgi:Rad3-related DNA helicase
MPTGSGKTGVVVAWALITQQPTAIITENLGLMAQYMEDFKGLGMVSLMGKRRYACDLRPDYTCEDGQQARCPHRGTVGCPLSAAECAAATSSLVVTNYDKWTASRKYGQGMEHFTQAAFDEGHEAPGKLASAMQVVLSAREINDVLGMDFPKMTEEMVDWKAWASMARAEAEASMLSYRQQIQTDPKPSHVKTYIHLRNLTKRLSTLATCRPEHWVVDEIKRPEGFQFDPVRVGRYAENSLLMRLPNILVVSATLRPKTLYMIGIGKDQQDFREFDSEFDQKRCPIYYIPTMRVDKNATDLSPLWIKLDQIAARRTDRKGIVHTISYARRDDIVSRSRFWQQMIINPQGEPSTETVQEFFDAPPGTILVSPSVGQGFDFAGKRAEWQFITKIPFPDSRSKIVRARQEDDKEWGPLQATNKLAQIAGRIMRFKEDQGETFICDEHLNWFLKRWGYLFPRSFNQFFKRVEVAPPPPPRL